MFTKDYFLSIPEKAAFTQLRIATKDQLFAFLGAQFAHVYGVDEAECTDILKEREAIGSTGFGRGIAIPHGRLETIRQPISLFIQLDQPFAYDAVDAEPVDLVWALMSPTEYGAEHLKALAHISRMLRNEGLVQQLRGVEDPRAAHALLSEQLQRDAA